MPHSESTTASSSTAVPSFTTAATSQSNQNMDRRDLLAWAAKGGHTRLFQLMMGPVAAELAASSARRKELSILEGEMAGIEAEREALQQFIEHVIYHEAPYQALKTELNARAGGFADFLTKYKERLEEITIDAPIAPSFIPDAFLKLREFGNNAGQARLSDEVKETLIGDYREYVDNEVKKSARPHFIENGAAKNITLADMRWFGAVRDHDVAMQQKIKKWAKEKSASQFLNAVMLHHCQLQKDYLAQKQKIETLKGNAEETDRLLETLDALNGVMELTEEQVETRENTIKALEETIEGSKKLGRSKYNKLFHDMREAAATPDRHHAEFDITDEVPENYIGPANSRRWDQILATNESLRFSWESRGGLPELSWTYENDSTLAHLAVHSDIFRFLMLIDASAFAKDKTLKTPIDLIPMQVTAEIKRKAYEAVSLAFKDLKWLIELKEVFSDNDTSNTVAEAGPSQERLLRLGINNADRRNSVDVLTSPTTDLQKAALKAVDDDAKNFFKRAFRSLLEGKNAKQARLAVTAIVAAVMKYDTLTKENPELLRDLGDTLAKTAPTSGPVARLLRISAVPGVVKDLNATVTRVATPDYMDKSAALITRRLEAREAELKAERDSEKAKSQQLQRQVDESARITENFRDQLETAKEQAENDRIAKINAEARATEATRVNKHLQQKLEDAKLAEKYDLKKIKQLETQAQESEKALQQAFVELGKRSAASTESQQLLQKYQKEDERTAREATEKFEAENQRLLKENERLKKLVEGFTKSEEELLMLDHEHKDTKQLAAERRAKLASNSSGSLDRNSLQPTEGIINEDTHGRESNESNDAPVPVEELTVPTQFTEVDADASIPTAEALVTSVTSLNLADEADEIEVDPSEPAVLAVQSEEAGLHENIAMGGSRAKQSIDMAQHVLATTDLEDDANSIFQASPTYAPAQTSGVVGMGQKAPSDTASTHDVPFDQVNTTKKRAQKRQSSAKCVLL